MSKTAKKIILGVVLLSLFILTIRFFVGGDEDTWICNGGKWVKHGNPNTSVPERPCEDSSEIKTETITYTKATADLIVVQLPFPGAVTGKEFSVIGQARGFWFFEASFPIEVLARDGKVLATGIAQAQGEWMTENFVPFKADIKVPESYIGPATLILKKDNPSGLSENDASISFPINIEY